MPRPTSKGTSWAAKFDAMAKEAKGGPEEGFYTVFQWSEKLNRAHSQTLKICKAAFHDGAMERRVYRIPMPSSGPRPVTHYRLVKESQ